MRLSNRIIPRDEKGVSENEAHRKAEGSGARSEGQSESRRTSRSGGGDSGKRGCSQARRSVRRASGVRPPPVQGRERFRVRHVAECRKASRNQRLAGKRADCFRARIGGFGERFRRIVI
jgi:hypothetical protein